MEIISIAEFHEQFLLTMAIGLKPIKVVVEEYSKENNTIEVVIKCESSKWDYTLHEGDLEMLLDFKGFENHTELKAVKGSD